MHLSGICPFSAGKGEPLNVFVKKRNMTRVRRLVFCSPWPLPNVIFKCPVLTLEGISCSCLHSSIPYCKKCCFLPSDLGITYLLLTYLLYQNSNSRIFSATAHMMRFTHPIQTCLYFPCSSCNYTTVPRLKHIFRGA